MQSGPRRTAVNRRAASGAWLLHTWWFHEINDYLKPEYKVVTTDLSESEDEFNVDCP
jgi:hypothetical protein